MGKLRRVQARRGLLLALLLRVSQCNAHGFGGSWATNGLSIVGAIRVLAAVRVGAIASSGTAISTRLLISAVWVATVAAVLVVAGHVWRVLLCY